MKDIIRYKTNTIRLAENGIVYFKPEADDVYEAHDLIAILDLAEEAAAGKPLLLLMMVNEFEFLMTEEARKLFGSYEKAERTITAEAVLVRSTVSRMMYNLLIQVHRPKFPFKAFTEEKDAVEWLLGHA
ncbi:MAG: hypothetical protein K9J17_18345 [Flavobacteriales bacterium]|nr:hypothetical protein [Flavobacteriales bacterium]